MKMRLFSRPNTMAATFILLFSAFGVRGLPVTLTDDCCDGKVWFKEKTYDGDTPPARSGHAMAYHNSAGHQFIVMFGGDDSGGTHLNDTWLWSGLKWFRSTGPSPTARRDHAMAFLPASGIRPDLTILFGGFGSTGNKDDTWGWNGNGWINKTPGGTSPSPRQNHAMAYDGVNDKIIIFGGNDGAVRDDTWLFDGTTWIEVTPANRPPARQNHTMAYDADRKVVVLFGGDNGGLFGDTWEWNGTDWQNKTPSVNGNPPGLSPSPRRNAAMAYAGECSRILLFGGETPALSDEYWERQGTEWTLVPRATAPSARAGHAAAFHDGSPQLLGDQFLVFGGDSPAAVKDTWAWGFQRINDGNPRSDVTQLGITRELWKRELTTKRFSWHKVGKFLNISPGSHNFDYKAYTVSDPTTGNWKFGNFQTGIYEPWNYPPDNGGYYTQGRAKKKCNDNFTDCPDCASGCMADNTDCHWCYKEMPLFWDYELSGNFCNPVFVSLNFHAGDNFDIVPKIVGDLYTDGVFCGHFNSPAIPPSQAELIACHQDRHPGDSLHQLINTIKGKEGRVDTQWRVSRVGNGISAGLNELDAQCTGGGPAGSPCEVQYFEFGQDQSDLRFKLTIRGSSFAPVSSFCFYVDADNDPNTGSPNYPECGADYRISISVTNGPGHPAAASATVECYNSCLDPVWQVTSFQPFHPDGKGGVVLGPKLGQTVLEVFVPLAGVGDPQGTYSAWVVSSDENGTLCSAIPNDVSCQGERMQLTRTTEAICPRVVVADPYAVTGPNGSLTAPVKVTFTEAMQPIVVTDVQIVPPMPFTVSQDAISQHILSLNPDPVWQPGLYTITLLPTIKDLSGNELDGNGDGVCGDPYSFEFCVPDMNFVTTDDQAQSKQRFLAGESVYVQGLGAGFPASTTFNLYLVIDGNVAGFGKKLADWSQNGPHTGTTDASGNLLPVNLGQPLLAGNFKVVADLNHDEHYDAGDRVTDLCGPGLAYGAPCYSTVDDIVAWWPFEDAALEKAAELMSANHGTLVGSGSSSGPGIVGKARFFSGGTYLSVADDSTSNDPELNFGAEDFSLEAWINIQPSDLVEQPLVDKRSAGVNFAGYYWYLVNGQLSFKMGDLASVGTYGGVGVNVADGQWQHVGVTVKRSGSGAKVVKLFVNGVVQATGLPILGSVDNTAELRIASNRSGDPSLYYVGGMDELELYDRALEPEEMQFIYNQRAAGKCTDAVSPRVALQPTNVVSTAGSQMTLSVSFTTGFPLTYQWYFNGVALTNGGTISGATNNVLTVNPVNLANAGYYSLVAGNFTGEETSQLIKVTVLPPILNFVNTRTNITLLWSNAAYRLQVANDLGNGSPTVWTNVSGSSPITQPLTGPRKFFRLISP